MTLWFLPKSNHMELDVIQRLEKFQLSGVEDGGVDIDPTDIKGSEDLCEKSLVGRIFGDFSVNYTGLKQTMTKLWCDEGELKVIELQHQMYQFVFTKDDERKRVLDKRPWTFDNQLLVIHPWQEGIDSNPSAFSVTPMWLQAWRIPVQWLSSEVV